MNHEVKQRGFTLIELMLSMTFVSVLLIAITMTVIQIGNIYNRGLTLKEVDQSGSSLASELQRSINQSTPFDITTDGNGNGAHYIKKAWGGRLCTGHYSYIWNYGSAIQNNDKQKLNIYNNNSSEQIHFIKVIDSDASYCTDSTTLKKLVIPSDAVELLGTGDHNLTIHSFDISAAATAGDAKTGQQIYNIDFIIGTNDVTTLNYAGTTTCKTPDEVGSDPTYCFVNQFKIVARAGNAAQ